MFKKTLTTLFILLSFAFCSNAIAEITPTTLANLDIDGLRRRVEKLEGQQFNCKIELANAGFEVKQLEESNSPYISDHQRIGDLKALQDKLRTCLSDLKSDLAILKKEINKRLSKMGNLEDSPKKKKDREDLALLKRNLLQLQSNLSRITVEVKDTNKRIEAATKKK